MSIEQNVGLPIFVPTTEARASLNHNSTSAISEIQGLLYERDASVAEVITDSIGLHLLIARAVSDGGEILIRNSSGWSKIDVPRCKNF